MLAIPPHSSAYISEHVWDNYKGKKWKQISEAENFRLDYKGECINKGHYKEYSADDSPYKYKYYILYSTTPEFNTYSSVNINLYVKYIVGESTEPTIGYENEGIDITGYLSKKQMNKCYNKVISNFESEPSMIVGILSRQKNKLEVVLDTD